MKIDLLPKGRWLAKSHKVFDICIGIFLYFPKHRQQSDFVDDILIVYTYVILSLIELLATNSPRSCSRVKNQTIPTFSKSCICHISLVKHKLKSAGGGVEGYERVCSKRILAIRIIRCAWLYSGWVNISSILCRLEWAPGTSCTHCLD